jgi:foldase protein PrsA
MKKKILMALVVLGLTAGCGKIPTMKNGDDAVVSFKNEKNSISVTDLYTKIKSNYALSSMIDMIDNKILLDKYPDKEEAAQKSVDEQFENTKKYFKDDDGNYSESSLLSALKSYYGINSISDFKDMLKLSYYRDLAVTDYAKDQITDKQIEKYYNDNIVGDISCSHILISADTKDSMTDAEKTAAEAKALATAKEVIKKLEAGEKFADLAKKYSDDDATKDKGGDLGYFNKGEMESAFETAAYALKLNEYTKTPVKTSYGYHIILKTGEKDKATLADSKSSIVTKLGKELQDSDKTLSINALVELRKDYGMEIEDSDLKKQYEAYISNQLLAATSTTTTTTTTKAK